MTRRATRPTRTARASRNTTGRTSWMTRASCLRSATCRPEMSAPARSSPSYGAPSTTVRLWGPQRAPRPGSVCSSERLRALEEEEAPTVTVVPTRGGKRGAAAEVEEEEVEVASDGEGVFPIADYDELKVGEIVSLLPELDEDELDMVREREEAGKNHSTILTRVEALTGAAAASSGGGDWDSSDRSWDAWRDEGEAEEEPEEEE